MNSLAAATYLANKPDGSVLICLVFALVLFIIGTALAFYWKAFWATVVCAGLAFTVAAFMVH